MLMLSREIIAVYSEKHTSPISTVFLEDREFFKAQATGTCSNHCALKVCLSYRFYMFSDWNFPCVEPFSLHYWLPRSVVFFRECIILLRCALRLRICEQICVNFAWGYVMELGGHVWDLPTFLGSVKCCKVEYKQHTIVVWGEGGGVQAAHRAQHHLLTQNLSVSLLHFIRSFCSIAGFTRVEISSSRCIPEWDSLKCSAFVSVLNMRSFVSFVYWNINTCSCRSSTLNPKDGCIISHCIVHIQSEFTLNVILGQLDKVLQYLRLKLFPISFHKVQGLYEY
jgi:hypothetical protein